MLFTVQLAASTPSPREATTVKKSTKVAANAFKFGPPYPLVNCSAANYLPLTLGQLHREPSHSTRVDACRC